ncbi:LysM peptidoglycan-binding domain-containing protein [Paenibacillus gansuensis]|uniref:LysM peptidoglycan-binding domain-containing protein n=1 Tax=Paenibacillus gansuensis TaxID=306542 RepID=A0ABW5PB82_9BACL
MATQDGLRFDIYERFSLAEESSGIQQLEEAELLPYIEVYSNGEQAVLRGSLQLTGKYVAEDDYRSGVDLTHTIPVEISIPMSRINRLEDIQVEIENFDIDLLSSRSLNVTGLLTLRGVQMVAETIESRWDEEEIVAVHQAPEIYGAPGYRDEEEDHQQQFQQEQQAQQELYEQQQVQQFQESYQDPYQAQQPYNGDPAESAQVTFDQLGQPQEREIFPWELPLEQRDAESYGRLQSAAIDEQQQAEDREPSPYYNQETEAQVYVPEEIHVEAQQPSYPAALESAPPIDEPFAYQREESYGQQEESLADFQDASAQEYIPAEAKEPRLAFGVTRDASSGQTGQFGFQNLIHNPPVRDAAAEEAYVAEAPAASASTGDELEWKTLFLNGAKEENVFRRLRMCIVQREETLTTIAERYNLNPREIVLYNRLNDQTVSEGQVLYIPR